MLRSLEQSEVYCFPWPTAILAKEKWPPPLKLPFFYSLLKEKGLHSTSPFCQDANESPKLHTPLLQPQSFTEAR